MKSWKHYAKWVKNKHPFYTLNKDLKSPDVKLKENAQNARKFAKKWGFRYEQTWELDAEIAKFVLPRLAYLRDNHCGYPADLVPHDELGNRLNSEDNGDEKWTNILNDMCVAFELIIKDEYKDMAEYEEQQKIIEKGINLFAKFYRNLWD